MTRYVERFAVWVALGLFVGFGALLAGPKAVGCFLVGTFLYVLPGWLACRIIWGSAFARRVESLGHILVLGLLLTTAVTVGVAATGVSLSPGLVISVSLCLSAGLGLFQSLRKRPACLMHVGSGTIDGKGRVMLAAALAVTLGVVAIPLSNVGRRVADSYVYVANFNDDFFHSMAVAAQLSKGNVPVENPYFVGETLHYYWFYQVFPAFIYGFVQRSIDLQSVLLLTVLAVDIAFVCILVWLLRQFIRKTLSVAMVLCFSLLAESYQAPIKALVVRRGIAEAAADPVLAAIAFPTVGYYFQALLYVSQHLVALSALLLTLPMLNHRERTGTARRSAIAGLILGAACGFSFFLGFFSFAWAVSWLLFMSLSWRRRGVKMSRSLVPAALMVLATVVSYGAYRGLAMFAGGARFTLLLKPSLRQLLSPVHYAVMLGPTLATGLLGCVLWARIDRKRRAVSILWLLVFTFLVVHFVFLRDRWLEVSQKLGLVLRVPLLLFSGIGLDIALSSVAGRKRQRLIAAVALLCVSAVPNLLAYEWVHFDITDLGLGTYVRAGDRRGAVWIRDHTPPSAVVQSWPEQSSAVLNAQARLYSLVSVFAERQMAIGDYWHAGLYAISAVRAETRRDQLLQLFRAPQSPGTMRLIERYGIDYVFWGTDEMRRCGENITWYERSALFQKVYERDGVTIFRVRRNAAVPASQYPTTPS